MELRSENLEVQMNASFRQTPNQQTFIANEDVAVTSEMAIERSDVVEIEKTLVIQKKIIVNEKIVVPKQTLTSSHIPLLFRSQAVVIDANASLSCSEVGVRDSQESGKMEIASQESLDSRMDISSQESRFSLMEYSSLEADVPFTPSGNDGSPNKEIDSIKKISDVTPGNEIATPLHPVVLPTEDRSEKQPTIENLPYEAGCLKRKGSVGPADEYLERRLSTKKCLLTREVVVAAREEACKSREKAVQKRETFLANQGAELRETACSDLPSPKRLKLISVFEYS